MIVVLTGAGISQESGIATFRDTGGLWEQERIEDVATPGGFIRNPEKVYQFYNKRRAELQSPEITPNKAHQALVRLEKESTTPVLVVTQNVDDLHERAGSEHLLHMHGELLKARCTSCGTFHQWITALDATSTCPRCNTGGFLRPHIVWFEEMPLHMQEIEEALAACTLFLSIGTSGNVYPAAGFAAAARANGATVIELNLEPSLGTKVFHQTVSGLATKIVPEWVDAYLTQQ